MSWLEFLAWLVAIIAVALMISMAPDDGDPWDKEV